MKYTNIDEYINMFPKDIQDILKKVRTLIKKTIPLAVETISYGIPTYKIDGKNIIHFAGYSKHIGIYPGVKAVEHFKERLNEYKTSKGTIQFQLSKPIPYDLITEIVEYVSKK